MMVELTGNGMGLMVDCVPDVGLLNDKLAICYTLDMKSKEIMVKYNFCWMAKGIWAGYCVNDCCVMYRSNGVILMHSFIGENGVLNCFFPIFGCDLFGSSTTGMLHLLFHLGLGSYGEQQLELNTCTIRNIHVFWA